MLNVQRYFSTFNFGPRKEFLTTAKKVTLSLCCLISYISVTLLSLGGKLVGGLDETSFSFLTRSSLSSSSTKCQCLT